MSWSDLRTAMAKARDNPREEANLRNHIIYAFERADLETVLKMGQYFDAILEAAAGPNVLPQPKELAPKAKRRNRKRGTA